MALKYVYDQSYFFSGWTEMAGWFDGKILESWFDEDANSPSGLIIQIDFLSPGLFLDSDLIIELGPDNPLKIIVFPGYFLDDDLFYMPASARALDTPDKALKNEIIRVR